MKGREIIEGKEIDKERERERERMGENGREKERERERPLGAAVKDTGRTCC